MSLYLLSWVKRNKLTAGDRGIITSIRTEKANNGAEGALQNHQVVTGRAVHIIQYDGVGVWPKTVFEFGREYDDKLIVQHYISQCPTLRHYELILGLLGLVDLEHDDNKLRNSFIMNTGNELIIK